MKGNMLSSGTDREATVSVVERMAHSAVHRLLVIFAAVAAAFAVAVSSASGFGYVAQWGCPDDSSPKHLFPSQGGIAASDVGVVVGDSGTQPGVVVLDPATLKLEARWRAPAGAFGPVVVGSGGGTIWANVGTTTYLLAPSRNGLALTQELRRGPFTALFAAHSKTSNAVTYFALAGGARQIIQLSVNGDLLHRWYLNAQDPLPVAFAPWNGTAAVYVAETNGSTSRVAIYKLPLDQNGPAELRLTWATEGVVSGVTTTADTSVWTVNGGGIIQQFSRTGAPTGRYDGSDVPGGFGVLAGVAPARIGDDIVVLDATAPATTPPYPVRRDRVVRLSRVGHRPRTGGGPGSPLLDCGAGGVQVRDTNPVAITGARLVSARHPLRHGTIDVFLDCRGAVSYCDASASSTTYVPRVRRATATRQKVIFGKDVEKRIRANTRAKLKVPVPRRARRVIRRAHAHHQSVRVDVSIFAFNPAGNKHGYKFLKLKIR